MFPTQLVNLFLVSPFPPKKRRPTDPGGEGRQHMGNGETGARVSAGPLGSGDGAPARFGTPCPALPAGALGGRACQLLGI